MTKLLPLLVTAAATAAVASAAPALAADLSPIPSASVVVAPAAAPAAAPSVDWTGFYAGGQLSFGRLTLELDDADAGEQDRDGAVGGLHAGYLRDFGRVVAGAELAYDRADLSTDDEDPALDLGADLDAVTRLGARVGYDAGPVLPYATAGYANATFSDDLAGTDEDNADGYFFGAGLEYALTDRVSLGAEVLRHEFDVDADALGDDLDTSLTTVGVRASYRF